MRVARLIIYEGTTQAVMEALGRSMPQGVRHGANGQPTLTVVDVPPVLFRFFDLLEENVETARQTVQPEVPPR